MKSQKAICIIALLGGAQAARMTEATERHGFPGVTFMPGALQGLAQAEAMKVDYSDFDYSGKKGWEYTEDPRFANEKEYVADLPLDYNIPMSLAQQRHRHQKHHRHHKHHNKGHQGHKVASFPGTTFLPQHSRQSNWWHGNTIPNMSAWTDEHSNNSNEEAYRADSPKGYPASFFQRKHAAKHHGRHHSAHHKKAHKRHHHHQLHEAQENEEFRNEVEAVDPMAFRHQAWPAQPFSNFIYPVNTKSVVVENP